MDNNYEMVRQDVIESVRKWAQELHVMAEVAIKDLTEAGAKLKPPGVVENVLSGGKAWYEYKCKNDAITRGIQFHREQSQDCRLMLRDEMDNPIFRAWFDSEMSQRGMKLAPSEPDAEKRNSRMEMVDYVKSTTMDFHIENAEFRMFRIESYRDQHMAKCPSIGETIKSFGVAFKEWKAELHAVESDLAKQEHQLQELLHSKRRLDASPQFASHVTDFLEGVGNGREAVKEAERAVEKNQVMADREIRQELKQIKAKKRALPARKHTRSKNHGRSI